MEIKWLKTFIISAQYENFRKASEEQFLTQPAITKQIKRLEESLSVKLFERNGKSVRLTPAGHRFLPYAREVVSKYEEGLVEFEGWKQGYKRKLTIATAPQIASSFLPSMLRAFIEENPDIEVFIHIVSSYEVGDEVSIGKADMGLSRIQALQANVQCEKIHEERVLLVAPNDGPLYEKQVLSTYRVMTNNHPEYWDSLIREMKSHYPFIRTMNVNQVEITKRFIEHGLGVSYLPYTMVKDELQSKSLIEINNDKIKPPTSSTFVVTKIKTEEVNNFLSFLLDVVKEGYDE